MDGYDQDRPPTPVGRFPMIDGFERPPTPITLRPTTTDPEDRPPSPITFHPATILGLQMDESICSMIITTPPCWRPFLILGLSDGQICFFPGDVNHNISLQLSCYIVAPEMPVEALAHGDLRGEPETEVVAICAEGTLMVFKVPHEDGRPARAVYQQAVQANIKYAHIMDIDGDGFNELVCVLTDRVVRTYRWQYECLQPIHKWEVPCQINAFGIGWPLLGIRRPSILVSQLGASFFVQIPLDGTEQICLCTPDEIDDKSVLMLPHKTRFAGVLGCQMDHIAVRVPPSDRVLINECYPIIAVCALLIQQHELVVALDSRGDCQLYSFKDDNAIRALQKGTLRPFATFDAEIYDCEYMAAEMVNMDTMLISISTADRFVYLYTLPMDEVRQALGAII